MEKKGGGKIEDKERAREKKPPRQTIILKVFIKHKHILP